MSTTPQTLPRSRSTSRTRAQLPSRPTTPLRPSSRSSLRASQTALLDASASSEASGPSPLDVLEPQFAELSDGLADLEANMLHLSIMHDSVARFTESFAAFLYGLNMNAFCVDFVEGPIAESFARADRLEGLRGMGIGMGMGMGAAVHGEHEATFLTTDTSFVENPPMSTKSSSKFSTPGPVSRTTKSAIPSTRGTTRGRGGIPRASGIARGMSGRGRARGK